MNVALVLAAGLGLRMNQDGEPPKQFFKLGDKPVLMHTLSRFEKHPDIDSICVVCLPTWEEYLQNLIARYKIKKVRWIVAGGNLRQESVYNGLCALERDCPGTALVIVHDGVRPFIKNKIISDNITCAAMHGNAMTGMCSTDTLVTSYDGLIAETAMVRDSTFTIQTPQTYPLNYGLNFYRKAISAGMVNTINCCELFMAMGEKIYIVNGRKSNIKLTTPDDIAYLKFLSTIFHEHEEL